METSITGWDACTNRLGYTSYELELGSQREVRDITLQGLRIISQLQEICLVL
jgi:hypothetical protein